MFEQHDWLTMSRDSAQLDSSLCIYMPCQEEYGTIIVARNLNMMDLKDSIKNTFLVGRLVQKFLFLILNGNSVKVVDQDPVRAHASAEYKHL